MKKKAQDLKKGDVVTSGEEIVSVSVGTKTPSGKIEVTLKNKNGKTRTALWGKSTTIGVKEIKENKIIIKKSEVVNAINESMNKAKARLMDMTGDEEDHMVVEPVSEPSIEDVPATATEEPSESGMDSMSGVDGEGELPDELTPSTPPTGLIEVMGSFDEIKSKLSKLAVDEQNEDIQKAIYAYYDKINKLTLEMIKDFRIVH